jgi:16S rRNA (adenine(1408)-N(1))-methyltransferase
VLFVGVDAVAENLRDASRRAAPNALFGRLALQEAPGELAGFADRLTVLFPWGSLLRAVALGEPAGLSALRGVCRPGAEVQFVFELASDPRGLERAYRNAALALSGAPLPVELARALPTTWAKKLGFSGKPRSFWDFRGRAL